MAINFEMICGLALDALKDAPAGQYAELRKEVVARAINKGLLDVGRHQMPGVFVAGGSALDGLNHRDRERISEMVRQAMWRYLVRGILVFGLNDSNPNWPFYQLTPVGHRAVEEGNPQPYDPDGFMDLFKKVVGAACDPVVEAYVGEAIHTFNAGCLRASAVMLGAASEKLILLAVDALGGAISDAAKKTAYDNDLAKKWMISHKYNVLTDTLDKILAAKKTTVPKEQQEFLSAELPSGYEILRRVRNIAGHPEAPGTVDADGIFINLRFFPEYARRMSDFLGFLKATAVTW